MTNVELGAMLLAIVSLLTAAHLGGYVFERLHLPRVGGEITGGILLGPTGLGTISPSLQAEIFAAFPGQDRYLSAVYWIGLIMLMFIAGFRLRGTLRPDDSRTVATVTLAAIILPFAAGLIAPAVIDLSALRGSNASTLSFGLVFAIAFAVTSIPVISKIFLDLGVMNTRFAAIVLTAATIEDIILWVALAVATQLATHAVVEPGHLVNAVVVSVLFLGLSVWLGPPLLRWATRFPFNATLKGPRTGFVLGLCFIFTSLAAALDVNVVFGALVAGIVVGTLPAEDFDDVRSRIADVSLGVLVPVYFATVGYKLNLLQDFDLVLTLGFLIASSAVKIGCVALATRFTGHRWATALNFAVAMNTRGGPGIVLATIAYEFGLIAAPLYTTLVIVAVLTSILSGAWLRLVVARRGTLDVA
jgi:Kef-type K+ transport system membrane component KefB